MNKKINYVSLLYVSFSFLQFSLGADTKLLLNYSCLGVNSSSSDNIVKELVFFVSNGFLKSDTKDINGISITDFVDGKKIEPVSSDQSMFGSPSVVILKRGKSPLGNSVKNYIALRLSGVSQAVSLKLADNGGGVAWGRFKINLNNLIKLEKGKKDQIIFYDFKSAFFDKGQLFYLADGDIVRILLLNETLSEVLWEGAVDSRNFHDVFFNSLVEDLLKKEKFSIEDIPTATRQVLMVDEILRSRLNVNWINPVQITLLKDIQPSYVEEE